MFVQINYSFELMLFKLICHSNIYLLHWQNVNLMFNSYPRSERKYFPSKIEWKILLWLFMSQKIRDIFSMKEPLFITAFVHQEFSGPAVMLSVVRQRPTLDCTTAALTPVGLIVFGRPALICSLNSNVNVQACFKGQLITAVMNNPLDHTTSLICSVTQIIVLLCLLRAVAVAGDTIRALLAALKWTSF